MASSLALKRFLSSTVVPRYRSVLRPVVSSRLFNTNADDDGVDVDRRSDRSVPRRCDDFFSDVFDPFSPTRSVSQVLNLMDQFMENPLLSATRGHQMSFMKIFSGPFSQTSRSLGRRFYRNTRSPNSSLAFYERAETGVFVDIENCVVPENEAHTFREKIEETLQKEGYNGIVRIFVVGNMELVSNLRVAHTLITQGVSVFHIHPHQKKPQEASDKLLIVKMFCWAMDQKTPGNLMLISGDGDFADSLLELQKRGFNILLVVPVGKCSPKLREIGKDNVWDWSTLNRLNQRYYDKKVNVRSYIELTLAAMTKPLPGWSPKDNNGGTCVAIAGSDYCVFAVASWKSAGLKKIHDLANKVVLSSSGFPDDVKALQKDLKSKRRMSCPAMAQLLSNTLYLKRFFPYHAFHVLGGLDEKGKGCVFTYDDALGSWERVGYSTQGSGSTFIMTLLDNQLKSPRQLLRPAQDSNTPLSEAEAVDLVKVVFASATERDIYTGDMLKIMILKADGSKVKAMDLRID